MPIHTQQIHQHTDDQDVIHRYCLLSSVELYRMDGRRMEVTLNQQHIPHFTALLDTGASNTYLGQGLVDSQGLVRVRESTAKMGNGEGATGIYEEIRMLLPHNLGTFIIQPRTTGAHFKSIGNPHHLIIGMDILSQGIFSINGPANEFTLEFPEQ